MSGITQAVSCVRLTSGSSVLRSILLRQVSGCLACSGLSHAPPCGQTRLCVSVIRQGHSGCFHLLSLVNPAALNTGVRLSEASVLILGGMKCLRVLACHLEPGLWVTSPVPRPQDTGGPI